MTHATLADRLTATENAAVLHEDLTALKTVVAREAEATLASWRPAIQRAAFLPAAANLAMFLAFRKIDLRAIQERLIPLGLSSLGGCEAHVQPSLDAATATLASVAGLTPEGYPPEEEFVAGAGRVDAAKCAMFGPGFGAGADQVGTRIMVTLPTEAASEESIVRHLVYAGADSVRINCAHDDEEIWAAMITHVRNVAREIGREIRINMDLGGPKIRTDLGGNVKGKRLFAGDRFVLLRSVDGAPVDLPAVALNHPELVSSLTPGTEIWLDDGKIGGRVEAEIGGGVVVEVTSVRPKGVKLKHGKGVNLPGVPVEIPALTEKDLRDLDFVAQHADTVGFSFVQTPQDVRDLIAALEARRADRPLPAVILKIETDLAVRNLPRLLVQAGGHLPVAAMIARGDLSVELGPDRTSEMQEEILWMCAAAHVPVVWATQVLESLMKEGRASRAEVTDAAMGQRAECVMLNKGPYAPQGIAFLHEVLRRMERHHGKSVSILGPLRSWQGPQTLVP